MKNKSHISKWAIALCAVAVFSLSGTAYGVRLPDPTPAVTIQPTGTIVPTGEAPPRLDILPPPPIQPVESGSFIGSVIVD